MNDPADGATLWTVGHSNRGLAEFLALLGANGIQLVADVRRFPASRRHPHFSIEPLSASLAGAGIDYVHLVELGGHRTENPGSPHVALPPGAFRGYADHMESPEFTGALEHLCALARERRTVAMCAEASWQDCHRRLLSDRLLAEGARVMHLAWSAEPMPHVFHPAARFHDGRLIYATAEPRGLFD